MGAVLEGMLGGVWQLLNIYNGQIDEVRISNIARYKSNFTPRPRPSPRTPTPQACGTSMTALVLPLLTTPAMATPGR